MLQGHGEAEQGQGQGLDTKVKARLSIIGHLLKIINQM